jgi:hypothetical protein
MIEKYLKDSIGNKELEQKMLELNLEDKIIKREAKH